MPAAPRSTHPASRPTGGFKCTARRYAAALLLALPALAGSSAALPAGGAPPALTIELSRPPARVVDGDTFEADLDGNGRLDLPRERVRLLFVDTPELSESHKGRDVPRGLAARAALAELLARPPLRLELAGDRPQDAYGRTLALVTAGGRNVNLELIRQGHSTFDTRFSFPPDYDRYAQAEAEAFGARRGIWSSETSRRHYLHRLKSERKTPRAPGNPLFLPGLQRAERFDGRPHVGRYVTLEGRLVGVKPLGKGVRVLSLAGARGGAALAPLRVVALGRTAERLGIAGWPLPAAVRLEGFVQTYRGKVELLLHHGRLLEGR
ncbi:MAG: thermonuclease family protein [Candidatus Lambdaproteobacteria bacterium]|nr:thermonuclease family protein [Candidatus Lambdaproteobacteria bacterium]